jgi:hypothetical protein
MYESLNEPRMYLYTLTHSMSIVVRDRDADQAFVALQRLLLAVQSTYSATT